MNREEKLKEIQRAHDQFVEQSEEPEADPEAPYDDANQFGIDVAGDQEPFVRAVDKATADPEEETPDDRLEKAVEGLQALLEVLKSSSDPVR